MKKEKILSDKSISILEDIFDSGSITQRDIAKRHEISLGQANSVLKQLIEQELLKTEKAVKGKVKYVLTSDGEKAVEENALFELDKTVVGWNRCLDVVEKIIEEAAKLGFIRIALVEHTGFERMFEYVCLKTGRELVFVADNDTYIVNKKMFLNYIKNIKKKDVLK